MKHLLLPSPLPLLLHRPSNPHLLHPRRRLVPVRNAASGGSSGEPTPAADTATGTSPPAAAKLAGVKDRLKARNQARRVQLDSPPPEVVVAAPKRKPAPAASSSSSSSSSSSAPKKKKERRKEWGEMSVGEKAAELYVGEKGLLFWLNKFAYASIFIMVGAWVLFRFVGPSLGLYQLDAPPLPPAAVFGAGSP